MSRSAIGQLFYALLAAVLVALAATVKTDGYVANILMQAATYAIAVFGLSIVLGLCGQINLAQAAFFALGAYSVALGTVDYHIPFWLCLLGGMAIALAAGAGLGLMTLRLGGHYLAMVTISFQQILTVVLTNAIRFTHGPDGVSSIPRPAGFTSGQSFLALVVAIMAISGYLVWRLADTRLGRAMRAVRDNELAASANGIDVYRTKLIAFALAALLAGLGGGLFASGFSYISPDQFAFADSIVLLTMALLGGAASPIGSAIGTGLLILIPEWLRFLKSVPGLYLAVYGAAVILIVLFMPDGIWGYVSKLFRVSEPAPSKPAEPLTLRPLDSGAPMALEVRGLCKHFGGLKAVDGVDLQVRRGGRACPDRPQRQRQDNHGQCRDRSLSSDRRRNFRRRRRRDNAARAQAHRRRPRAHVPEHSAVPVDDRYSKMSSSAPSGTAMRLSSADATRFGDALAPRSISLDWGIAPTRRSPASAMAINA